MGFMQQKAPAVGHYTCWFQSSVLGSWGVMPCCWGFLPYRKTCNCAKREAKDYCAHKNEWKVWANTILRGHVPLQFWQAFVPSLPANEFFLPCPQSLDENWM
jgi:hypothetical protein